MKRLGFPLVFLLVIGCISSAASNIEQARATSVSQSDANVEVTDFNNGTRKMVVDYQNGTRNCIAETFIRKEAELLAVSDENSLSLSTDIPNPQTPKSNANMRLFASLEESTAYVTTTETMVIKQPMMLGFTYTIAYWQEQWDQSGGWWWFSWYLAIGLDVDIQFGLRLPMNITLQYPEKMAVGNNYTFRATLNPLDKPDFSELLFTFKANIWAEANVCGINIPRTVLWGPNVDKSQSFVTPLGSDNVPLPINLEFDIFDVIQKVYSDPLLKTIIDIISKVVVPYLILQPTWGSDKITAEASALGDARVVEGAGLSWSTPNQTLSFLVDANEYDPTTNCSKITISNFKYYFTRFALDFKIRLDLNGILNGWPLYLPDPIINIATLDMSWIVRYIGERCVTSHPGYPGSIYVMLYVDRIIDPTPPNPVEDVAISYASVSESKVYSGRPVNVTVGAKNLGDLPETFEVTIYVDNTPVGTSLVSGLGIGEEVELNFVWDTAGFSPGHTYNLTAKTGPVPNDIDEDNNILSAGSISILLPFPTADFAITPGSPVVNQMIAFDATNSTSPNGNVVSYIWDFGEGVNDTTQFSTLNYTFTQDGNHKVSLTVVDSAGLNSSIWKIVYVRGLRILGDCNGDGIVDIMDMALVASAFGSYPGHPRWDDRADEHRNSIIDVFDLVTVALHLGETG